MTCEKLKLLQLNIEQNKHFDRILPFLSELKPDVVCLQELREPDIPRIAETLGAEHFFIPMMRRVRNEVGTPEGIAIFSRLPVQHKYATYYAGTGEIVDFDLKRKRDTQSYGVAVCEVNKNGVIFKIATTHFTWTPDGQPSEDQRKDMKALLAVLQTLDDVVISGDFNAPRGGEMFAQLAERFKDNVPSHYVSSLDRNIHPAGHLDRMVDGIFSTNGYEVSNVVMIDGLSDHCALVAEITKN